MFTGRQVLRSRSSVCIAAIAFTAALCSAQSIAPAHSGTVHYFEGDVTVDGVKIVSQVARFTELKEQSVLQTGLGRAEILLTPGVILRVAENSSIKMLDNRLMSTRVEFLSGSAMMESIDAGTSIKDPAVTIIYKNFEAQYVHNGLFELKSQPGELLVYKGEARVTGNGAAVNVKENNRIDLTITMATSKFDSKDGDDLYGWSRDRSAYLAAGNMASARALSNSGYVGGYANANGCASGSGYNTGAAYIGSMGYGSGYPMLGWNPNMWRGFNGGWYYNQCLNMYSYMPFAGTMYSPFGYGLYNPMTIGYVYAPAYYWSGAGGAKTGTTTGIAMPTLAAPGSTAKLPTLPRLGTTATAAPTLSTATRTTLPAGFGGAATFRNTGFANQNSGSIQPSSGSSNAVSVRAAAPPALAAPAAAAAPAARGGGRR